MNKIAISIPVYNDSSTIEALVLKSNTVLSSLTDRYQILVINDGSKDNTSQVLENIRQTIPQLKIYDHKINLGFGKTIKEVYTLPESEWVIFIPGDGQIMPSELLKLYTYTKNNEFILGYRKLRQDLFVRKFNSWCYNWIISIFAGRRVHDVNSVALLKRDALKDIQLYSASAFIHAEIFLKLMRKGVSFIEVEIEHKPRLYGRGSGNRWKVILETVVDMLKYLYHRIIWIIR